jgi:hypothetical protein
MLLLLLLIFLIIVLIFIYIISRKKFNDSVKFVNKSDGCKIFNRCKYLKNFTEYDRKARNISPSMNLEEYYCSNILEFSQNDRICFNWLIEEMLNLIPNNHRFILRNIKICKLSDVLEMGFPHTHSDCIFISNTIINTLKDFYNKQDKIGAIKNIGLTIIHEQLHILQREESLKFRDLYINYWGFVYNKKPIVGFDKYTKYYRSNPDMDDITWILKLGDNNIVCMSIYKSDNIRLDYIDYIGVYLNDNDIEYSVSKTRPLNNIKEFTDFFGIYVNQYHPNEISAELISNYYGHLMGLKKIDLTKPALKSLVKWFDNIKLI